MNMRYTKEDAEAIYELYKDYNITLKVIVERFNIKTTSIHRVMKRFGFPLRPAGFQVNNCYGKSGEDLLRLRYLWFKQHGYIRRATRKGLEFSLTDEEFINLVTGDCFYCGKSHLEETRNVNDKLVHMLTIDRLDSNKGYMLSNCVPACKTCNTIKMDLPYEGFIAHIKKVLHHIETKGRK